MEWSHLSEISPISIAFSAYHCQYGDTSVKFFVAENQIFLLSSQIFDRLRSIAAASIREILFSAQNGLDEKFSQPSQLAVFFAGSILYHCVIHSLAEYAIQ